MPQYVVFAWRSCMHCLRTAGFRHGCTHPFQYTRTPAATHVTNSRPACMAARRSSSSKTVAQLLVRW
jgi:hypothetical protein